jgi:hypothetical protein
MNNKMFHEGPMSIGLTSGVKALDAAMLNSTAEAVPSLKKERFLASLGMTSAATANQGRRLAPAPTDRYDVESILGSRRLFFCHRLSVSPATALALAGVLALASVIGRFATALTLARVLAFTSVLILGGLLVRLFIGTLVLGIEAGPDPREQVGSLNSAATREQTGERRTNDQALV